MHNEAHCEKFCGVNTLRSPFAWTIDGDSKFLLLQKSGAFQFQQHVFIYEWGRGTRFRLSDGDRAKHLSVGWIKPLQGGITAWSREFLRPSFSWAGVKSLSSQDPAIQTTAGRGTTSIVTICDDVVNECKLVRYY